MSGAAVLETPRSVAQIGVLPVRSKHSVGTREWFDERIDKRGPDECWPWTGQLRADGYGRCHTSHASRVYWELVNGQRAGRLHVLHSCDNKVCCNPAHLSLGTAADNMRQMAERGRSTRGIPSQQGETNPRAKLSAAQVTEIRRRYVPGVFGLRRLAAEFGVSHNMIRFIVRGESWTHL